MPDWFGNDVQSVARWEKSGRTPKVADRFLRALYRENVEGNAQIMDIIERLNQMDQDAYQRKLLFEETRKGWRRQVA